MDDDDGAEFHRRQPSRPVGRAMWERGLLVAYQKNEALK